jgi:hypothetical protein
MTSRDFCYWLQGYFEIMDPSGKAPMAVGPAQVECIRKHLDYVFERQDQPAPIPGITWPNDTTFKVC